MSVSNTAGCRSPMVFVGTNPRLRGAGFHVLYPQVWGSIAFSS
jgi:hypothetical protein